MPLPFDLQKYCFVIGVPAICIAISLKCLLDVIVYKRVYDTSKLKYRQFTNWSPLRWVAMLVAVFVLVLNIAAVWDAAFNTIAL